MTGNQRISAAARQIYETLRSDIALGRLHPRERLVEADLAEQFRSNRPAVREALSMLTRTGLIRYAPNKGMSVAELDLDELEQIYRMRIELEALAASWLPLPFPADALAELEAIQAEHSRAVEERRFREIVRLNEAFHAALNARCGNRHLEEMIELMAGRGLLARYSASMDQAYLAAVREDHWAIVDALRACDRERLVVVMRRHNGRGLEWYSARLRQRAETAVAAPA